MFTWKEVCFGAPTDNMPGIGKFQATNVLDMRQFMVVE